MLIGFFAKFLTSHFSKLSSVVFTISIWRRFICFLACISYLPSTNRYAFVCVTSKIADEPVNPVNSKI